MQKLAMNALGDTVVAHDDVLFCSGDLAEAAYFVQSGRLKLGGRKVRVEGGGNPRGKLLPIKMPRTYHCEQDVDDDEPVIPVQSSLEEFCLYSFGSDIVTTWCLMFFFNLFKASQF